MAALAVVEGKVDALVDEVLDDLATLEIALGGAVQGVDVQLGVQSSTPWHGMLHGCRRAATVPFGRLLGRLLSLR